MFQEESDQAMGADLLKLKCRFAIGGRLALSSSTMRMFACFAKLNCELEMVYTVLRRHTSSLLGSLTKVLTR
jgi:hypothetical protein